MKSSLGIDCPISKLLANLRKVDPLTFTSAFSCCVLGSNWLLARSLLEGTRRYLLGSLVKKDPRMLRDENPIQTGWWFQTWFFCSISYMGCHPSHWRTHNFSRWAHCTTNQQKNFGNGWWSSHWCKKCRSKVKTPRKLSPIICASTRVIFPCSSHPAGEWHPNFCRVNSVHILSSSMVMRIVVISVHPKNIHISSYHHISIYE